MALLPEVTEEELQELYAWVDAIPLSRPKKAIQRDFADAVLMAEVVHHFFPRLVELHNYSPAHNMAQKLYNWQTLNQRVLRRLGCALPRETLTPLAGAEAGAVERLLKLLRGRMARYQEQQQHGGVGGSASASGASRAGGDPGYRYAAAAALPAPLLPGSAAAAAAAASSDASDLIAAVRLGGGVAAAPATSRGGGGVATPTLEQALRSGVADWEQQLAELRETNELLETKILKLEQLVRLKDAKIQALQARVQGTSGGAEGAAKWTPPQQQHQQPEEAGVGAQQ